MADADELSAALAVADERLRLPRPSDRAYLPTLLDAVERLGVRLLVPLDDHERGVLARHRDEFAQRNCVVAVSSPEAVEMCDDKHATVRALARHGLRVPQTWLADAIGDADLPERLFVRPRRGTASVEARPMSREDALRDLPRSPETIVQEYIARAELTVDALLDLDGAPIHFVPRLRLRTEAGRSIRAVTVRRPVISEWAVAALRLLGEAGARGPLSLQAFREAQTGRSSSRSTPASQPEWRLRLPPEATTRSGSCSWRTADPSRRHSTTTRCPCTCRGT